MRQIANLAKNRDLHFGKRPLIKLANKTEEGVKIRVCSVEFSKRPEMLRRKISEINLQGLPAVIFSVYDALGLWETGDDIGGLIWDSFLWCHF